MTTQPIEVPDLVDTSSLAWLRGLVVVRDYAMAALLRTMEWACADDGDADPGASMVAVSSLDWTRARNGALVCP